MQIYVSGSLAYDRIMSFPGKFSDHILPDKIHILNVCFMVDGLTERFGGTAGNIAYSLSLLGESPLILATSGKDFEAYEQWLRSHDLSLEGIVNVPQEFTAGAYITTDQSDNQITGFNPGAMKFPSNFDFTRAPTGDALAIIGPGNLQDMQDYAAKYRELNIPYIFDPGQSIPAFSGEQLEGMLTGAHIFISNDYEQEMVSKATGLSLDDMLARCENVITTLGEQGSRVHAKGGTVTEVGVAPVSKSADPTGAGDSFRAGLIKGITMGLDLPQSAQMGAVCASYCVELLGTQEHTFTPADFTARHEQAFGPMQKSL